MSVLLDVIHDISPAKARFPFLCVEEFYSCLFETLQDRPCKQPPHNHLRRAISVSAEKE